MPDADICAVTGANGYLGSRIAAYLKRAGWVVYELRHDLKKGSAQDERQIPYSLEEGIEPDRLRGVEALIHCAYDFRPTRWDEIYQVNVRGTARLLEAAQVAGVRRIILISTMSAFEGCRSLYGKAKLEAEKEAAKVDAIVIRPGLVFGKTPGGTLGALKKTVEASKIVPLVGRGDQIQYLAHEEDLCRLILKICRDANLSFSQPLYAAAEKGKTIREIVETLAKAQGEKKILIPIPWRFIWLGLKSAERAGLHLGLRSDSLIGLVYFNRHPDFSAMRHLGIPFREFTVQTLTA